MRALIRLSTLLCASVCVSGCAPMLAIVGYGSGSVIQVVAQIERVKLVGDGVSYVGSGKTITDHALSMAMGADCKLFNVVTGEPVCVNKTVSAAADTNPIRTAAAAEPLTQTAAQTERAIDNEDFASAPAASSGGE